MLKGMQRRSKQSREMKIKLKTINRAEHSSKVEMEERGFLVEFLEVK
jgi:hypothetical protein